MEGENLTGNDTITVSVVPQLFSAIYSAFQSGSNLNTEERKSTLNNQTFSTSIAGSIITSRWPDDALFTNINKKSPTLACNIQEVIESNADSLIATIRNKRASQSAHFQNRRNRMQTRSALFASKINSAICASASASATWQKELDKSNTSSRRRLQELLYECLGEMRKAVDRSALRISHHQSRVDNMVHESRKSFLWSRFVQSLSNEYPTGKVRIFDLPPTRPINSNNNNAEDDLSSSYASDHRHVSDLLIPNETFVAVASEVTSHLAEKVNVPTGKVLSVKRILEVRSHLLLKAAKKSLSPDTVHSVNSTTASLSKLWTKILKSSKRSASDNESRIRRLPKGTNVIPAYSEQMLLNAKVIGSSLEFKNAPVILRHCRIYFCVEEVLASTIDEYTQLGKAYVKNTSFHAINPDATLRVRNQCLTSHLNESLSSASSSVLQVSEMSGKQQNRILHFASASIKELLKTDGFSHIMSNVLDSDVSSELERNYESLTVESSVITSLYYCIEDADKLIMRPVSNAAVEELVHTYVVRSPTFDGCTADFITTGTTTPSLCQDGGAFAVLPQELDKKYCVVDLPSAYDSQEDKLRNPYSDTNTRNLASLVRRREEMLTQRESNNCEAFSLQNTSASSNGGDIPPVVSLIVEYDYESHNLLENNNAVLSEQVKKKKKKKNSAQVVVPAALCHFCLWRACVQPAVDNNLCQLHSEIKLYLDKRHSNESVRFLPKNTSSKKSRVTDDINASTSKDLAVIRESSSLLQELLSEKLSKTITLFCRKAASASSSSASKSSKKQRSQVESKHRVATLRLKLAQQALSMESNASRELEMILSYDIFPSMEVSALRKEFKTAAVFASFGPEAVELTLEEEVEISSRKYNLFRQRRVEVENGVYEVKKSATTLTSAVSQKSIGGAVSNSKPKKKSKRPKSASSNRKKSSTGSGRVINRDRGTSNNRY